VAVWDARTGARVPELDRTAPIHAKSPFSTVEAVLSSGLLTVDHLITGDRTVHDLENLGASELQSPDLLLLSNDARFVVAAVGDRVWRLDLIESSADSIDVDRRQTGVMTMSLSDDGTVAIAAAIRGYPAIWGLESEMLLPLLDAPDFARSVVFTANGANLAVGLHNATVMLWDIATRRPLALGRGHRHAVTDVAYHPGRNEIASVSLDRTIRLWNAESLSPTRVLHGHHRAVWYVSFSSDGSRIATVGEDRTARIWDLTRTQPPGVLTQHDNIVFPVEFSPDGSIIASAGWDNTIRLADAQTHDVFAVLPIDADVVTALCFSPDSSRLAAVTNSGYFAWDLETGTLLPPPDASRFGAPARLAARALSFDPDSVHVALPWNTEDERWHVWNTTTGVIELEEERNLSAHHSRLVSPDGRFYVQYASPDPTSSDPRSARSDSGAGLAVVELSTGRRCNMPALSGAFAFGMPPAGGVHLAGRLERDRTVICVWDLTNGEQVGLLQGHAENVYAVAYSPDSTRIATAGRDSLRLWDAVTLQEIVELQGHTSFVWSVAFSPDGTQLVSGSGDRTVRVWDTKRYRDRHELRRQRNEILTSLMPIVRREIRDSSAPADVLTRVLIQVSASDRVRQIARQAILSELLKEQ